MPSPSLTPAVLVDVAGQIEAGFAGGFDGALVIQGTDTIEESAFILDLLVGGDRPVVVTGAMRGADAPGADGPANLLAAIQVLASPDAHGLGTLVVLNDEIHAARFVQKAHTALPSAFASPLAGPIGMVAEGRPRFFTRVVRKPVLPQPPVRRRRWPWSRSRWATTAGYSPHCPELGFAGVVVEGMGAGHVPAEVAPILGELAAKLPVVLAARPATGPMFTATYGYPGSEMDLIHRGLVPAGYLSALKARLLLGLSLRAGRAGAAAAAFAAYQ